MIAGHRVLTSANRLGGVTAAGCAINCGVLSLIVIMCEQTPADCRGCDT